MFRFLIATTMVLSSTLIADTKECSCSPQQTSKAFTAVAKKTIPAVVFIKVEGALEDGDMPFGGGFQNPFDYNGNDLFQRFFGGPPQGKAPKQPQLSQGSGFFVSADGYVMTNAHVVKNAEKMTVVLNDGKELNATLVGADAQTDIAIIKVDGKDFPFLHFGDSDALDVGEWVVAIGSPFQLEASLTVGVVSAKGRQNLRITDLEDFIQTDAAINPGNSGGPLENLDGEVIGINTAIVSRTGGYMGIGFAVPSNMAKGVMTQLIDKGTVTRGFLGVSLQPVDKDIAEAFHLNKQEGVLVSEVLKDSPADKAGVKQGDVIVECNGAPIKSLGSFRNEVSLIVPGKKVTLKVNRNGQIITVPVTLGTASENNAEGGVSQKVGLEVENLTPELARQLNIGKTEEGVVITKVKPGTPAAMAGMHPGFLIVQINQSKITNVEDFNNAMNNLGKDKRIILLIRQGNHMKFYTIKLS